MTKETGGPAFPVVLAHVANSNGMTLRDYFATKALQGAIAGILADGSPLVEGDPAKFAKLAYQFADAMLEARK